MKNVHLLPAKLPIGTFINLDNGKYSITNNIVTGGYSINYCLCITNEEQIKNGDWYIAENGKILKCRKVVSGLIYSYSDIVDESYEDLAINSSNCKKIILTTDSNLQRNGVQHIDLNFLTWFLRNPTCKEVEIETIVKKYVLDENDDTEICFNRYVIIIPKV
jgi:hypothetical protein